LGLSKKSAKKSGDPPPEKATEGKTVRQAIFEPAFREDLRFWTDHDRKIALRIMDLAEAVLRDPFDGIGKPEPLKYLEPNTGSRRITDEHRLVYIVYGDRIKFLQARFHYAS
jgi:toxin YoeB